MQGTTETEKLGRAKEIRKRERDRKGANMRTSTERTKGKL